jgi:hypothetical protein
MVALIILGFLPTATAASAKATSPTSPSSSAEMVSLALPRNNLPSAPQSMLIDSGISVLAPGYNLVIIGGLMTGLLLRVMRHPVKDRETVHDLLLISKKSEVDNIVRPSKLTNIHTCDTSTVLDPPTNLRI